MSGCYGGKVKGKSLDFTQPKEGLHYVSGAATGEQLSEYT